MITVLSFILLTHFFTSIQQQVTSADAPPVEVLEVEVLAREFKPIMGRDPRMKRIVLALVGALALLVLVTAVLAVILVRDDKPASGPTATLPTEPMTVVTPPPVMPQAKVEAPPVATPPAVTTPPPATPTSTPPNGANG